MAALTPEDLAAVQAEHLRAIELRRAEVARLVDEIRLLERCIATAQDIQRMQAGGRPC